MKQILITLYRDDKTGIAFAEDHSTGCRYSAHPSIDASGSVRGMKNLGYWGKKDRVVQCCGFKYNIDRFCYDNNDQVERLVAQECRCAKCTEMKEKKK